MRFIGSSRTAKIIVVVFLLIATIASSAWAGLCPMCRQALEQSNQKGLLGGFYLSILLIAGMPLLIFSVLGLYFLYRKKTGHKPKTALH